MPELKFLFPDRTPPSPGQPPRCAETVLFTRPQWETPSLLTHGSPEGICCFFACEVPCWRAGWEPVLPRRTSGRHNMARPSDSSSLENALSPADAQLRVQESGTSSRAGTQTGWAGLFLAMECPTEILLGSLASEDLSLILRSQAVVSHS